MNKTYEIYLVSDSTGETLDRIFLALHAQFSNFKYKSHLCSFTRTENQIIKILQVCNKKPTWISETSTALSAIDLMNNLKIY